jgi:hypothetical protein
VQLLRPTHQLLIALWRLVTTGQVPQGQGLPETRVRPDPRRMINGISTKWELALPKSVESGNLSVDKAVIR